MSLRSSLASAFLIVALGSCNQYVGPADIPCISDADCPGGYACAITQFCIVAGSTSATAPAALKYATNPATYAKGLVIAANKPTSSGGAVVSYGITPTLPAGLSLNATTGIISGTPTTLSPETIYTVTATNPGGSTTVSITITVNDVAPSGLSYPTNPAIYTINVEITDDTPSISGGAVLSYAISPSLPAGLSFSTTTGVLSGKPTALSPETQYTVSASNSGGTTTAMLTITVNDVPPSGLMYATNPATYAVSQTVSDSPATGGGPVISWAIDPDMLPAGLHFSTATGVLSGVPTEPSATAMFTVTAMNSGGETTATLTITVDPAISVAPLAATVAQGDTYAGFSASGGVGTLTWTVVPSGAGVGINPSTGSITVTPTASVENYAVTITDTRSNSATAALSVDARLSIAAPTSVTIVPGDSYAGFTAAGGVGADTWSLAPAGAGVSINPTTGAISSTVSASVQSYTVTATDTLSNTATATVTLSNQLTVSPSTVTIAQGDGYQGFFASGGVGSVTWTVSPFGAGVSIVSSSGVVSTTASAQVQSYTVTATDMLTNTASATLIVNAVLGIAPATATIAPGDTYSGFSATGGAGSVTWSLSPALASASINPSTGIITTTRAASVQSYTVKATDSLSNTATATLIVNASLAISPVSASIAPGDSYSGFSIGDTGVGPITWTISPSGLGASVDSSTGAISSTDSAIVESYTVTATDSLSNTATATLTVNPTLSIEPALATIAQGDSYSGFATSGGVGASTWSITPTGDGVTINASTGVVTASESAAIQSYTMKATDTLSNTATAALIVNAAPSLLPATATISQGDSYPGFSASGGVGSFMWTVSPPGAGVTINASTGAISTSLTASVQSYLVTATDTLLNTATATLTVSSKLAITPSPVTIAQGDTYSGFFASGGVGAISWTISPTGAGVSIDPSSGIVSSTASASVQSYTVTATDSLSNLAHATLTVNAALVIAPASTIIAQGDQYLGFSASGGVGTDTWSVSPTGDGISINSGSGVINASGAATVRSYTVSVTDMLGNTSQATLTVNAALAILPGLATIAPGDQYLGFSASGGSGSVSWSITPSGLGVNINSSTGAITSLGNATIGSYTVKATDTLGNTATATLTMNAALAVAPNSAAIAPGDSYSGFSANGGVGTITWSIAPPGAGVSVNSSSGVVSTTASAQVQSYTVTATDSLGNTAPVTLTVNPALALAPSSATIAQGDQYTGFSASGGVGADTWSITPTGAGVSIGSSTGVVTATVSAIVQSYTVKVTDTLSNTATATLTVNVSPTITPATATVARGDSYSGFSAGGGVGSFTWSVSPLGTGITINATTGVVTVGASATVQSYTVKATDTLSNSATATLTVNEALAIAPTATTLAQGDAYPGFTASGGVGAIGWTISPAGAGVGINASTGFVDCGMSATVQTYTITATDALMNTATATLTVNVALKMTGPTAATIAQGNSYSAFSESGGVGSVTWSVSPASGGVSINSSSGTISSTTSATVQSYMITATDSINNTTTASLAVNAALALAPISAAIIRGTSATLFSVSGGVGADTWSVSPSGAGVSVSSSGLLTATLTAPLGSYAVTATDTLNNTATATLTVNDVPPQGVTYSTNPAIYTNGQAIRNNIPSATAGGPVVSFAINPSLPAGLSFSTTTGIISGTPTALSSTTTYTVTATNSGGSTTVTLPLTVMGEASTTCGAEDGPNGTRCLAGEICDLNGLCAVTAYTINGDGTVTDDWTGLVWQQTAPSETYEWSYSYAITAASESASTVTLTASNNNAYSAGNSITVTGMTPAGYNGTWTIVSASGGTLTYADTNTGLTAGTAFGTVVLATDAQGYCENLNLSGSGWALPSVYQLFSLVNTATEPKINQTAFPNTPEQIFWSSTPDSYNAWVVEFNGGGTGLYDVIFSGSYDVRCVETIAASNVPPRGLTYSTNPATYTNGQTITNNIPSTADGGPVVSYAISPSLPAGLNFSTSTGILTGTPTTPSAATAYTVTATNLGGSTTTVLTLTVMGETSTTCGAEIYPGTTCPAGEICDLNDLCAVTAYTINGDGTVTDEWTGLVWQQAVPSNPCPPDGTGVCSEPDGITYCQNLSLSGSGWTLPTVYQLFSLINTAGNPPAIDKTAFPNTPDSFVWSSTVFTLDYAWNVNFNAGGTIGYNDANSYSVRCVR